MDIKERISVLETELSKLKEEEVNNRPDVDGAKKFILDKLNGSIFKLDGDYQIWSDVDGRFLFARDKKLKVFYMNHVKIIIILYTNYRISENEINEFVHNTLCESLELNGYATTLARSVASFI